jgi:hypothetical protein
MAPDTMKRSVGLSIAIVLALAQAAFVVVRAVQWHGLGQHLVGQGFFLLPIAGFAAFGRGAADIVLVALYSAFVWGALSRKVWARAMGLLAATLNILAAVVLLLAGESVAQVLVFGIAPILIAACLLAPSRSRAAGWPSAPAA